MLIVGDNLQALITQYQIVDDPAAYDVNSISLSLDRSIVSVGPQDGHLAEITFGQPVPEAWIQRRIVPPEGVLVPPKGAILGCSKEFVRIPAGYFGFLQTKGSLARLFTSINCCDGQVEAGYTGKVTFEIVNMANFGVRILPRQQVAQLFIFTTSTRITELYNGRYQNADGPTIQAPEP